jgi:hypothetical protein
MNSIINICGKHALFHTVNNAEFTGVYDKLVYNFANNPGDNRGGFICNYHFFIRYGDKIYMDVKGIGEIVITFAALQQNKYWKHYYDLSLMLTNSKDKNLVIQYHKYGSEYLSEKIYEEPRLWSFNTAYIETSMNSKDTHIKNYGNICYYKINPYELVNMEYTSQEDLDIFKINYITKRPEKKNKVFDIMCIIYKNLAVDYNTQIIKNEIDEMEKELEELSVMFEDKKNIINLVILNNKIGMNDDIQMIIYNYIISQEGYKKYEAIILDNSNKLVSIAQIMAV